MKILSVFCDESGDFGVSSDRNAYYLVTMVYHDQNIDLSDAFQKYDEAIGHGKDTGERHGGKTRGKDTGERHGDGSFKIPPLQSL